jgi:phospholipase C
VASTNRFRGRLLWIAVIVLTLVVPTNYVISETKAQSPPSGLTPVQQGFMQHIDHIIFVVLENHAYDNDFGTYCLVKSKVCPVVANGLPAGTCVPMSTSDPTGPCVRPWNYTANNYTLPGVLPHNLASTTESWDLGKMDGFYAAEYDGNIPFGHYNGTTAPIYWDLAEEYGLDDNFFSSNLSYSLPNHWHIVAGQAPAQENVTLQGETAYNKHGVKGAVIKDHQYLNESNQTASIETLLATHPSVSWNYYDVPLQPYQQAIGLTVSPNGTELNTTGGAYNYFNPLAAVNESYTAKIDNHLVARDRFYTDARNGSLPDISWVIPSGQDSDHAPYNSTLAQSWLASIVDALEESPDWNTSVMYVTWDDYGGFYDNVDPPVVNGTQLSFRVPLLTISPYALVGHVSHYLGYFESVLHLMEWRFGLGTIGSMDRWAPLPLWGLNFTLAPHHPLLFPTNFSQALYPYNPNWNGTAKHLAAGYYPPLEFIDEPEVPDVD